MGLLIDASILIDAERGRIDVRRYTQGREHEEFFLSVITASELLHGVDHAANEEIRHKRSAFVEAIVGKWPILEIDLQTARSHARIWAYLASRGILIGPHDLWLGATCLARGLRMDTANVREFSRITGLEIEEGAT